MKPPSPSGYGELNWEEERATLANVEKLRSDIRVSLFSFSDKHISEKDARYNSKVTKKSKVHFVDF